MSSPTKLPDIVIGGAYRGGTTSLRHLLDSHPQVFFPRLAEPSHFAFDDGIHPEHLLAPGSDPFHRRRTPNLADYEALFAPSKRNQLTGDCSPEYLRAPGSFARLAAHNPNARVVVTLRHPVDRVISDWQMCRRDGVEPLDLDQALDAIDRRRSRGEFGGHYLETSRYSHQLPELLDSFASERVLVLIHEQWTADRRQLVSTLTSFLEIDPSWQAVRDSSSGAVLANAETSSGVEAHNRSGEPRNLVFAAAYRARRRLAPILGGRIPPSVQRVGDRLLQRGLVSNVSTSAVRRIEDLLSDEVAAVEAVLGRRVPEWHR